MTIDQKVGLQDDLFIVRNALEKAKYVWDEICTDFFEKAASQDERAVVYSLPRYAAFHHILGDLLNEIEANLPSREQIEDLEVNDNE